MIEQITKTIEIPIADVRLKRELNKYRFAIRRHHVAFDDFYQLLIKYVIEHQREVGSYYHMDWGDSRTNRYVDLKFDEDRNITIRMVRIPDFPKSEMTPWYHVVFLVSIPSWHPDDLTLIWERCLAMHRKYFQLPGHMWSYNDMKNYTIFVEGLQKGGGISRKERYLNQKHMNMITFSVRSKKLRSKKLINNKSAQDGHTSWVRARILGFLRRFFYKRLDIFYQKTKNKYIYGKLKHYVICLSKFTKVLKTMAQGLRTKLQKIYSRWNKTKKTYSKYSKYSTLISSNNTWSPKKRRLEPIRDYPFFPG